MNIADLFININVSEENQTARFDYFLLMDLNYGAVFSFSSIEHTTHYLYSFKSNGLFHIQICTMHIQMCRMQPELADRQLSLCDVFELRQQGTSDLYEMHT